MSPKKKKAYRRTLLGMAGLSAMLIAAVVFENDAIWNWLDRIGMISGFGSLIFAYLSWSGIKEMTEKPQQSIATNLTQEAVIFFEMTPVATVSHVVNFLNKQENLKSLANGEKQFVNSKLISSVRYTLGENSYNTEIYENTKIIVVKANDDKKINFDENVVDGFEEYLIQLNQALAENEIKTIHVFCSMPVELAASIGNVYSNIMQLKMYHYNQGEDYVYYGTVGRV